MMLALVVLVALAASAAAAPPRVLMVQAHPDDETQCAGALYSFARNLGGVVDIAVVTDGQGGYNCSEAAEFIYGEPLYSDPAVGRLRLPEIRAQEMLGSAKALGVREVFFLGQPDVRYTLNASLPLDEWWDTNATGAQLDYILRQGQYDAVVVFLPDTATHGEHKAASILALEAVQRVPDASARPLVAGCAAPGVSWAGELPGYPITAASTAPGASFNRSAPLHAGSRINYHVVVDLALTQHRSQGCLFMELSGPRQEQENYYFFAANGEARRAEFDALMRSATEARYRPFSATTLIGAGRNPR